MNKFALYIAMWVVLLPLLSIAQQNEAKIDSANEKWTFHFQQSMVNQWHGAYNFKYAGLNSLDSAAETKLSLTTTMFIGRKLWKGGALYLSPEVTAGNGLSYTHGIAGFTNGEIYRVGNPTPTPFVARLIYRQVFSLGGKEKENIEDGFNQLHESMPADRLTINVGKFCLSDFFDGNSYNHDARSQFLNWALMGQGAWDFPADTRGYTSGVEVEIVHPKWSLMYAFVQMSKTANSLDMDLNMLEANGQVLEYDRKTNLRGKPGVIRGDLFINNCRAPRYADAVKQLKAGNDSDLVAVINSTKTNSLIATLKYGFGINFEQQLTGDLGFFARYSWNDGKTASWEFTDIDRNLQAGIDLSGTKWQRPQDKIGIAEAIDGISKDHQEYLAQGGNSFIIGDGKLNYGNEIITEAYYKAKLQKYLFVSFDYQLIFNPGYNRDRQGPISVPGLRVHVEF